MAGTHDAPRSAIEAILQNMVGEQNELREPQSRNEELLLEILEKGGGTTVVANPELIGNEDALLGVEVDGTKYKVNQPTDVEANPTLEGTEADLTGLKVGDTKYKIPVPSGGNKLYRHNIYIKYSSSTVEVKATITIVNDDPTAFTLTTIKQYYVNKGCTSATNGILASGVYRSGTYSPTDTYPLHGSYVVNDVFYIADYNIRHEVSSSYTLTDTVFEL